MIVKSAGKPPENTAGELIPFPSDLSSQLFSGSDGRELQMHSYPFYLETEGFRYPGYWAIGIAWVLFGLFWKFGRPAWIRYRPLGRGCHQTVARDRRGVTLPRPATTRRPSMGRVSLGNLRDQSARARLLTHTDWPRAARKRGVRLDRLRPRRYARAPHGAVACVNAGTGTSVSGAQT